MGCRGKECCVNLRHLRFNPTSDRETDKALKKTLEKIRMCQDGKRRRLVQLHRLSVASSVIVLETNRAFTGATPRLFKLATLLARTESSEPTPKLSTRMVLQSAKFFRLEPF